MRPIPSAAIALVKQFEGYRDTAYKCPAGVWTIAYGHTSPEVKQGLTCTKRQGELWLVEDLQIASRRLAKVIDAAVFQSLTDEQFSALLSFAFNLGVTGSWRIWKVINARKFEAVPAELMRFVNAGGKPLPGLVRRRAAEAALWGEEHHEVPPSTTTRLMDTPPTPPPEAKPIANSKTMWAGGVTVAAGVAQGAQQVQALVAPQAPYAPFLEHLGAIVAGVIVAAGVAVMVFRFLDEKAKRR